MSETSLPPNLHALIREFEAADVRELHVRHGDFELYLSKDGSAGRAPAHAPSSLPHATPAAPPRVPAPEPPPPRTAPAAAAAAAALPEGAIIVAAPNLGTFYRSPKPGAAFYVEVGSKVSAGDELCLIEVMKLFTAVRAAEPGTIHTVLVEDGAMVEGGQPLFAMTRD